MTAFNQELFYFRSTDIRNNRFANLTFGVDMYLHEFLSARSAHWEIARHLSFLSEIYRYIINSTYFMKLIYYANPTYPMIHR